jgi:hypothetical protein
LDERGECFTRLSQTLAALVARAEQLSLSRCPYRNRFDECTAEFGCVNQRPAVSIGELPACRADAPLNHQRA